VADVTMSRAAEASAQEILASLTALDRRFHVRCSTPRCHAITPAIAELTSAGELKI
jgi:hypothetical protein